MIYENLLLDFIHRTKRNLEEIQKIVHDTPRDYQVYEVTQLINSLLGLLIFPKEKMFQTIPEAPYLDLVKNGWPQIKITQSQSSEITIKELVRFMRNSIAHFNVEFLSDGININGVKLWNERNNQKNWEAEFTIDALKKFIYRFCDLLENGV